VVSGDLTACGATHQFSLASDFLGPPYPGSNFTFGLGLVNWADASISGNHDQWPGSNRIFGNPTAGLAQFLSGTYPRVGPLTALDQAASIRFLFVDSDADVSPFSRDRLLARGQFVSQLTTLRSVVPARQHGEIRVLVVHHAVSTLGYPQVKHPEAFPRPSSAGRRRLEIDRKTLHVLEHALVDLDIQVIFTGHLHVPRLGEFTASNDVESIQVLEARCGTTTQLDRYPYEVLQQLPYKRILPPNTLICHELIRRDGGLVWRAQIYWRAKGRGVVSDALHVSGHLPLSLGREQALVV